MGNTSSLPLGQEAEKKKSAIRRPLSSTTFNFDQPIWNGEPLDDKTYNDISIPLEWTKVEMPEVFNGLNEGSVVAPFFIWDLHVAPVAWKYCVWANIFLWTWWAIFPILSFNWATCEDHGLPRTPRFFVLTYLPALTMSLVMEWKAHRWLFWLQTKSLGAFKVGPFVLPSKLYLVMVIGISIAGHADLATSGLFLGKMLKSHYCPGNQIKSVWMEIQAESSFNLPNLWNMSIFCWALMGLQLASAVFHGVPRSWDVIRQLCHTDRAQMGKQISAGDLNADLLESRDQLAITNGAGNVDAMAESARMNMMTFNSFNFAYNAKGIDTSLTTKYNRATWMINGRRRMLTAALYVVFEGAFQQNLQASAIQVDYAANGGGDPDVMTIISVCLSAVMTTYSLIMARPKMNTMMRTLWDKKEHAMEEYNNRAENDDTDEEVKRRRIRLVLIRVGFSLTAIIGVFFTVNTLWKLRQLVNCPSGNSVTGKGCIPFCPSGTSYKGKGCICIVEQNCTLS